MAEIKLSTASPADGRKLAVTLLQRMEKINDTQLQDVRKSRDLLVAALEKFHTLPARERLRFSTIINDTLASAYAGVMTDPAVYDRERCEIGYMRMATKSRNERLSEKRTAR